MRTFLHILKLSILQQTTYRTALIAGLVTNFFFGLFRAAVVVALYAGPGEVNGLSLAGALTFVAIGQAMIAFLLIFGTYDLMATVYTGSIGSDLIRPVRSFPSGWPKTWGALVNLVMRGLLLVLVFTLFYQVLSPTGWPDWLWTCFRWRWAGWSPSPGASWSTWQPSGPPTRAASRGPPSPSRSSFRAFSSRCASTRIGLRASAG